MPWVFVYGTLMRGMPNHHLIKDHILQCLRATTTGTLYHLPCGYPMLVTGSRDIVYGEVMKMHENSSMLGLLDELEDFFGPGHPDNLYERVEREVRLPDLAWKVRALVYVCPEHKKKEIIKIGTPVKGGDWKKFIQTHIKKSNIELSIKKDRL